LKRNRLASAIFSKWGFRLITIVATILAVSSGLLWLADALWPKKALSYSERVTNASLHGFGLAVPDENAFEGATFVEPPTFEFCHSTEEWTVTFQWSFHVVSGFKETKLLLLSAGGLSNLTSENSSVLIDSTTARPSPDLRTVPALESPRISKDDNGTYIELDTARNAQKMINLKEVARGETRVFLLQFNVSDLFVGSGGLGAKAFILPYLPGMAVKRSAILGFGKAKPFISGSGPYGGQVAAGTTKFALCDNQDGLIASSISPPASQVDHDFKRSWSFDTSYDYEVLGSIGTPWVRKMADNAGLIFLNTFFSALGAAYGIALEARVDSSTNFQTGKRTNPRPEDKVKTNSPVSNSRQAKRPKGSKSRGRGRR
jgi:hypothetical protein